MRPPENYIYQADSWCEDCAERIMGEIRARGEAPADPDNPHSYDSNVWPKGPYTDSDSPSDTPTHCAAGSDCLNAETLPDGDRVGVLMGELTEDGIKYVREHLRTDPGSLVVQLWARHYRARGYDL